VPISWLREYWDAMAESTLPFLTGRPSAMELVFGNKVVFRRHEADGSFVVVDTKEALLQWASRHCYSFHPHLEDGILYFALDIDRRSDAMPLELAQVAAEQMAAVLDDLGVQYLLKFSGRRGFHFLWGFAASEVAELSRGDPWSFERRIVRYLRQALEERLNQHARLDHFRRYVPELQPLTTTNSADQATSGSLLLDENILHKRGSLRSPWSVHPETRLVSLPLQPGDLATFTTDQATPEAALARRGATTLPVNEAQPFVRLLADI